MVNDNPAPTATPSLPAAETAIQLPSGPGAATDAAQSVPMTAADEDHPAWLDKVDWVILGLLVVLGFVVASTPAYNSDVWLHLGAGRLIAHGEYFPGGADPFSCATEATADQAAVPWVNHSWLFELGLYLLYSAFGGTGTIIAKALLVAGLVVLLLQVRSAGTHRLLVAVCLTLGLLALSMRLFLQPVLFSYLFLAVTLFVLQRAGVFDSGPAPAEAPPADRSLWALPVLCLLWVNLDNWFVLGPLVVALCWAGVALARWRGLPVRVSPGRLAVVLGACLLACLVNPHHVRAFQLPPELAYLAVQAGDAVGLPVPNALAGGGRTLTILRDTFGRDAGQPFPPTMSPLSSDYLSNPAFGYTIAGVCFFPLLALGLVSFTLLGLVGNRPGAPPLQPARFLVWLLFAVLAILLYRLIPFFVIVAAPLTAFNLGDLLNWYTQPTAEGIPETPWVAPVRLARLLGVLVLVALLLLAWPGWLTGRHELGSRNHVAWEIPPDVSLQAAAERLAALQREKPRGEHVRVFNLGHVQPGLDLPCYCAWFAPGVKTCLDPRHQLFAETVGPLLKARAALIDERKKAPANDWREPLRRLRIDHVGVENFLSVPLAAHGWWSEPGRWLQQFLDRNVAVFAWSGNGPPWPTDAVLAGWNRATFGVVPSAERPPARGVPEVPEGRGLWERYFEPPPRLPQTAFDLDAKLNYGEFINTQAMRLAARTIPSVAAPQIAPMYSLGTAPLHPGADVGPWPLVAAVLMTNELRANQVPVWVPLDPLPPAVPVLMMRSAWRTAATASDNERSFFSLYSALTQVQRQENFLVNPTGQPPLTLRVALRRSQLTAALWTAADLGSADAGLQYQVHRRLADLYAEQQCLDLAAEHLVFAEQAWDALPIDSPGAQEAWRKEKKVLGELVKSAAEEIKRRRNAFDLQTATYKPMDKVRAALFGGYQRVSKERNQPTVIPWALTGMTLELLKNMSFEALSERERMDWRQYTVELLFRVGHARDAADILEHSQGSFQPDQLLQFEVLRAGTQGNYEELQRVLREREELWAAQHGAALRLTALSLGTLIAPSAAPVAAFERGGTASRWSLDLNLWLRAVNELANTRTLLGIAALEAGDTATARRHFDDALRGARDLPFAERAIAARYATLLERYQPRP